MQPILFRHYREILFQKFPPPGKRVLEIGASSDPTHTLLSIFAESGGYELTGIDLGAPETPPAGLPYRLVRMNANDMRAFADESFDAVICHGVLNNDQFFWRSLGEIRRVLRPDGLLYTMVPGFEKGEWKLRVKRLLYRIARKTRGLGLYNPLIFLAEDTWLSAVATYHYSPTPKDYYRFSESAVRDVVMEGFELLHYEELLHPPRILAVGRKKRPGEPKSA